MIKNLNTAVNKFKIQKYTGASDYKQKRMRKQFSDFHIYLNDPTKDRSLLEQSAHLHYKIINVVSCSALANDSVPIESE